MKKEEQLTILKGLSDKQIDQLIGDHWREIKGLIAEKRRRQELVPKPD